MGMFDQIVKDINNNTQKKKNISFQKTQIPNEEKKKKENTGHKNLMKKNTINSSKTPTIDLIFEIINYLIINKTSTFSELRTLNGKNRDNNYIHYILDFLEELGIVMINKKNNLYTIILIKNYNNKLYWKHKTKSISLQKLKYYLIENNKKYTTKNDKIIISNLRKILQI